MEGGQKLIDDFRIQLVLVVTQTVFAKAFQEGCRFFRDVFKHGKQVQKSQETLLRRVFSPLFILRTAEGKDFEELEIKLSELQTLLDQLQHLVLV